jgi:putative transposase
VARPLRIEFAGALYHLASRGNERRPIYRDQADRVRFLSILADVVERFHVILHAYVLMDNHYHLLVETLEANLARAMQALNGNHAQQFNRLHRRVGHLFQGRYKAILVDHDAYLLELSRYIHLNPVRAGIVERAEHYQWSSTQAYVGLRAAPPFLTVADVLGHFGRVAHQAHRRYREFLREAEERPSSESPLNKVVAGTLLGNPDWVRLMRCRINACLASRGQGFATDGEVPAAVQLRMRPTLDQVIDAVANTLGVDRQVIHDRHSRHAARAVAIHLTCRLSGRPQKEIGEVFGVGRFAVSKATMLIERELQRDRRLRRVVHQLRTALRARPQ